MKTKYCRYCNKDVSVADFSPLAHTKDGLSNKCKECVREIDFDLDFIRRALESLPD